MPTDRHLLAAEGYFELEMFDDALEELEIAVQIPGNRQVVQKHRVEIFIALKRWEDAIKEWEEVLEMEPDNRSTMYGSHV